MGTSIDTIEINGQAYVRAENAPEPSPIKIVILQRGWCMIGRLSKATEHRIVLVDAQVIRRWGTTRGLGEIAADGPTSKTLLDPAGRVEIHPLTTVAVLDCAPDKWAGVL